MKNILKVLAGIVFVITVLIAIAPSVINFVIGRYIGLPEYKPVDEVVWVDQNWKPQEWQWWYHVSQGSGLEIPVPYKWFTALEQPKLSWLYLFKPAPAFNDKEFLGRMGFLSDSKRADNPDTLPVGFTKTENYLVPKTGETITAIGLTCAACHTGQINYGGKGLRIEGGPGLMNFTKFKTAFGLSLGLTGIAPWRFNRFAENVLGEDRTDEETNELKQKLGALLKQGLALQKLEKEKHLFPTEEGFARLDALGRIGNFVFGTEINKDNYQVANAPVNFPHLWSVSWFDWAQYNGSVMQPMARNAGQALGVFAGVNLNPESPNVFESNIDVENLYDIENLLMGDSIFTGLAAPAWPEAILGEIERKKAARGKVLYEQNCAQCHFPPMDSKEFLNDRYWTTLKENNPRKYLKVTMKNIGEIGTDPTAARNWYQRTADLGSLITDFSDKQGFEYQNIVGAGVALQYIGEKAVQKKYDQLGLTPEERDAYNGYRLDFPRAPLAYKARPLNGIWATAPFLHNGAVPNLYEMFLPAEKRSKKFYLGRKEFDPVYVGYQMDKFANGFLLDTSMPGNSNAGHEFKGDGTGTGVIGPELSEDDRWALVEYLKTL